MSHGGVISSMNWSSFTKEGKGNIRFSTSLISSNQNFYWRRQCLYILIASQSFVNFIYGIMVCFFLAGNEIISFLTKTLLIVILFYQLLLNKKCITQHEYDFVILPLKLTLINGSNIFDVLWIYFVSDWYPLVTGLLFLLTSWCW